MGAKYVHLHTHSHYSLLNALPKIPDLVKAAKKEGMTALALTDNGSLYGAIEFYKECKKEDIKPIIGIDGFMAARKRTDKEGRIDSERTRIILLAKNRNGYKNLIKLVTLSHLEGFYYKPRIDREILEKYHEDLVCISPSFTGDVVTALKNKNREKAIEVVEYYKTLFKDFYIEITHHPEIENHEKNMVLLKKFADEMNVPIVAGHDVYYLKKEDKKARDTLVAIQKNFSLRDLNADTGDFHFISNDDFEDLFKNEPEAIHNTKKIAEMCNLDIELGKWVFPNFQIPENSDYDTELRKMVMAGLQKRKMEKTKEVEDRIEYELGIIKNKGYAPYFLVVGDLINFAHKNKILTTIRGSVAGSLVTYLAGITNVNPLEYKLPFERFLNPERPSAPDIDMDFADNRRDEMITYAKEKYGADKVAQIGTFGTMMARGAVRDVARALGYPYAVGDRISKLIPMGSQGFPMTIERAIKITPELKEIYKKETDAKEIIDMALKIEGCARHISVHAAGVVIAPTPLTDFVSLQLDTKGENKIITQYDMHAVEDAGLLKFDFLGIKNLSILADAVSLVKKLEGKEIDIENIPLNDKKTFEMLAKGETIGLFQLNGQGMTKHLKDLRPSTIHDINAMVALYRPGPMESIPEYIKRKHNPKLIKLLDPRMKDILSQSYGVITYQDDVMLIAINLAGYSWLEADKLRKAMGKKIPAEMEAQKGKLKEGLIKNGMSKEKSEELWALIEPFAAYGFNKAHAASYGKVAYQTAYMKANFPAIYMSAVLTADSGDVEKIGETIAECKRMDIPVLAPNINESFSAFTVVRGEKDFDKIRFGLTTIKNFGEGIAKTIIEERKALGKFTSLENFLNRIKDKNLNKKSLEALIKSGALDEFGERGQMLSNIEGLLAYNKEQKGQNVNHDSLFGNNGHEKISELKMIPAPKATDQEKLTWEKELLGLYISGHPLDKFTEVLKNKGFDIGMVKNKLKDGMTAVVSGLVEEFREVLTKKGERMCFMKLSDKNSSIEAVIFPKTMTQYKDFVVVGKCISIKGRISKRNDELSIIAEAIKELS